jgi:plastocyanin
MRINKLTIFLTIFLAIFLTVLLGACASTPTQNGNSQPATNVVKVNIKDFTFDPAVVSIQVGTTVQWTNNDSMTHTVTSDAGLFDSGNLSTDDTFSFTFDEPGTFTYSCTIHPSMTGTVEVSQ